MRKISYITILAAAASMFSCAKQETVIPTNSNNEEALQVIEQTVSFDATPIETKTAFGDREGDEYPTLWTANDSKVALSLNYAAMKDATVDPAVDMKTATLKADFSDDESGAYTFYALSPKTAAISLSSGTKKWGIEIPTTQTPTAGSVQESAQILVAKTAELNTFPTSPVSITFSHVTAYACMTLKNLVDLGGATISSVSITAGKNIAGRWYYNTTNGAMEEWSASATVTVNTTTVTGIWFALAPVDLAGETFKVVVNTTAGTITKQITWPSGKAFAAGHVANFNLNMSGCPLVTPKVYELVKDVEDLTTNSSVIITNLDGDQAISTTQNSNNRAAAGVTMSESKITDPADGVEVFTVKAGEESGTLAFLATTEAGYIYAASSSANNLKTQASNDANGSWDVSINTTTGEATVVAQGTNTRNHLRYNSSNSIFSCYDSGSSQAKVAFYKLVGSGDPVLPQVTLAADVEAEVVDDDIVVTWTDPVDANVDHYLVTCTGKSNQEVDPSDGGYIFENLSDGNYTITVTAISANASTYRNSSTWSSGTLKIGSGTNVEFTVNVEKTSSLTNSKGGVEMTFETSGGTWDRTDQYRQYSGKKMTVMPPSGKKLKKIVFTYTQNKLTASEGSITDAGVWTGNADSVVFSTSGGQVRYTKVVVTYE